jgi:DNA repair protein RecO (recombination protein O)
MSTYYTVQAIVLRRCDLGENDALVVLLSRERGKLSVIARGVKRPKSKLAALTQLFTLARFHVAEGRKMGVLSQGELEESFYALREDLWRMAYATYLCELVDRAVTGGDSSELVFDLLIVTLHQLLHTEDAAALVHSFELRLLALLGYEPVLSSCVRCQGPVGEPKSFFSAAQGGLLCANCHPHDLKAIPLSPLSVRYLRRLLRPQDTDLTQARIASSCVGEIEAALRAHIRYHLETEPRSAAFLRRLRAQEGKT